MSHSYSSVTRSASRVFALLALTALLVVGQATHATTSLMVGLANTVIGIGGRLDPTSANVPAKLDGTVVPPGYTYDPIQYPATISC
jgi:ABC-type transporter lipoprotein component MlaA